MRDGDHLRHDAGLHSPQDPGPGLSGHDQDALTTELLTELTRATATARVPLPGLPDPQAGIPRDGTPGGHVIVAHRGRVVAEAHSGFATLHGPDGSLLPEAEVLEPDAVFDVASLTKVLLAVTALTQVRSGVVGLDDPVSKHLPAFTGAGRDEVTVRHLLTHTSGLPAVFEDLAARPTRDDRVAVVLSQALNARPGRQHTYSCVGYQVLGLLLEHRTGLSVPDLMRREISDPLGLSGTGDQPAVGAQVVATEYRYPAADGLVRGTVHDEAAEALGGAGNAGVFATASDVLSIAEAIRTAAGPVDAWMRDLLSTDHRDPDQRAATGYGQAIGLRVSDASFMGADATGLLGHTGFTGTSMVIDPARELSVVLLTNRVHPVRSVFSVQALRRSVVELTQRWADRQPADQQAGE